MVCSVYTSRTTQTKTNDRIQKGGQCFPAWLPAVCTKSERNIETEREREREIEKYKESGRVRGWEREKFRERERDRERESMRV